MQPQLSIMTARFLTNRVSSGHCDGRIFNDVATIQIIMVMGKPGSAVGPTEFDISGSMVPAF